MRSPAARTSRRWRCTGTGTTRKALLDALAEQFQTAYSLLAAGGRRDEPLVALAGITDNARSIPPSCPAADRAGRQPAARKVQAAQRGRPARRGPRGAAGQHGLPGLAAGEAAGQFRGHGRAVIDADLAELLRWPRLRRQGKSGHL